MRYSNADFIDGIINELDSYSIERLPWVKKQWIHEINVSEFPFSVEVKAIYLAGMACDLVMQAKMDGVVG